MLSKMERFIKIYERCDDNSLLELLLMAANKPGVEKLALTRVIKKRMAAYGDTHTLEDTMEALDDMGELLELLKEV